MKVVIAGGSGALGGRLSSALLADGHEVVVLTRRPRPLPSGQGPRQVEWDGRTVGPWSAELEGSAIVNLAGELVDRRPTRAGIELLRRSRVEPTRALVAAIACVAAPVPVFVQASTLAIYGDAGDAVLDESSAAADHPPQMAGVATAWEAAVEGARTDRLVVLRTGIVLDTDTPALDRLLGIVRWGVGGRVGSGEQWVSWLHIDDWIAIVRESLVPTRAPLEGVVHATSPNPVRNRDLMRSLRRAMGRPAAPPTPAPLVRLGAVALRTDPALALTGRRAVPSRLLSSGFRFTHPDLDEALDDLLRTPPENGATMCYMESIGVRELRQHASRYLEQVAAGESIEITNHGRPVARLVPYEQRPDTREDLIAKGLLIPARGSLSDFLRDNPPQPRPPGSPSNQEILDEMRGDV